MTVEAAGLFLQFVHDIFGIDVEKVDKALQDV